MRSEIPRLSVARIPNEVSKRVERIFVWAFVCCGENKPEFDARDNNERAASR